MESPINESSKRDGKSSGSSHRNSKKESKKSSKHSKQEHRESKRRHSSEESSSNSDDEHRSHHRSNHKKSHKSDRDDKSKRSKESEKDTTAHNGSASGDISLSIEETNKLRAKLGLKPLTVDENKTETNADGKTLYIDKDTNQQFEHVPATNLKDVKEQKSFREKLEEQREKRRLMEKLGQVKSISQQADEEEESTEVWLRKLKQKEEAARKAKLLEEMDEELSKASTESSRKKNEYSANHLKGLIVEHDQEVFKEGQEVILTLKDRNILKGHGLNVELDEEEETDVLVNVNIMDDEKAKKNVENKKKKPEYNPYDEFDEDGMFKQRDLLEKYDEELNGEKKKAFKLGAQGKADFSDLKFIAQLDAEHKARAINLDAFSETKVASDYFTAQEMEKFKKPKKIRKVLRKNKMLKADDLLPLEPTGSKMSKNEISDAQIKQEPGSKVNLNEIDFGFKNGSDEESEPEEGEARDDDDDEEDQDEIDMNKLRNSKENEDLKKILDEENQVLEELHSMLNKTRQRVIKSIHTANNLPIKAEEEDEKRERVNNEIDFDQLNTINEERNDALTLDSMSEFCKNIGFIKEEHDRAFEAESDEEAEERELNKKRDMENMDVDDEDEKEEVNEDEEINDESFRSKKSDDEEDEDANILDDEPIVDRGLGAALKLAVNKGYLAQEKSKQSARLITNANANIQAKHIMIEEKNFYDIDDKYNRNRDKYSGPVSEFSEKSDYKPDIKLDYIDEKGRSMNEKEAFRYLSHRFHGKGSGKKKTEKRNQKIVEMEAMNKMSSVDTPLNTVALLAEKQKRLQQPFVVLSTPKGKNDQVTLHKR